MELIIGIIGAMAGLIAALVGLWQARSQAKLNKEKYENEKNESQLLRIANSSKIPNSQQFTIPKKYLTKLVSAPGEIGP